VFLAISTSDYEMHEEFSNMYRYLSFDQLAGNMCVGAYLKQPLSWQIDMASIVNSVAIIMVYNCWIFMRYVKACLVCVLPVSFTRSRLG